MPTRRVQDKEFRPGTRHSTANTTIDLAGMVTLKPPLPYQRGSYNPTGLGEQLLKRSTNGSVAYIGCNTGSQPCGLTLAEGFVNTLAEAQEPRLGDCWASRICHYFNKEHLATLKPNDDWYPPSIFFQGMKFMLFGDPSRRMPANRKG